MSPSCDENPKQANSCAKGRLASLRGSAFPDRTLGADYWKVVLSEYKIVGMARTTLRAKGQLTLPDDIRKAARLEEGDLLEAEITPDGILLRPQKVIDATQAWFWTPEWQAGEREADAEIAAGKEKVFTSDEALIAALRSRAKRRGRRASS